MRTFKQHLTELSKKTLGSYVKKATDDVSFHSFMAGDESSKKKKTSLKHDEKSFKRQTGIGKATDKLTKEETIVEAPIGPIKKGAMHADLGEPESHKITSKDIAKEKAKGGVEAKRAVFAQNAKKWHHEGVDMTADCEKVLAFEGEVEKADPLNEVKKKWRTYNDGTDSDGGIWGDKTFKIMREKPLTKKKEKPFRDAAVTGKARDFKNEEVETTDEAYSKSAVDKEIRKDKRIGGKEAKAIHRLLKGRQTHDEPVTVTPGQPQPWKKSVKEETIVEEHDMSDAAHELVLHADNDSHLHHGSHMPIIHNLKKKMKKGTYDSEKAKKLWHYHADRAAQSYHKHYGDKSQPWHKMFTTHDRKQAAAHWESNHRDELHEDVELDETKEKMWKEPGKKDKTGGFGSEQRYKDFRKSWDKYKEPKKPKRK